MPKPLVSETEKGAAVLVDCLTLWLTNVMLAERDVAAECDATGSTRSANAAGPLIFVANEVGLGIVPDNKLARDFRDHAGRLNQRLGSPRRSCAVHRGGPAADLEIDRDFRPILK